MELRIINTEEDVTKEIYDSDACQNVIKAMHNVYATTGFNPPWLGYFIINGDHVVGTCGFVGKPIDGMVEIAYWTFEAFEGHGVASFACSELINIARNESSRVVITAKTAPNFNASTRVLQKNGFKFIEVVQDHEIGDAWLWELGTD